MKILQVMAGAEHGGAETAFIDMCLALHDAGEEIEVVTRANDMRIAVLQAAGLKVHTLPFGGRVDVFTPWKLRKIIREFQPRIVQTWMARAADKTPAWDPSMDIPRYLVFARLGGYYKLKYFKSADRFVAITPDIARHIKDGGIPAKRVRHINNFAETEPVKAPVLRSDFGTPEDAVLLLGLGRLHPSKAFDTLIRAVGDVPDVHLWIAGEGPQRAELEKLIQSLNLQHRVKLLGWREDRAALFAAVDICVFSSRYEPFGTVFVQAWAHGVPLITTDADGPRQFVRHEEDGLVVPVDDGAALSAAIQRLVRDEALRQSLVQRGLERYRVEFTKEKSLQNYLDFYHQSLAAEGLSEI